MTSSPQDDQKKKIIIAVGAAAGITISLLAYKVIARYMGGSSTTTSTTTTSSSTTRKTRQTVATTPSQKDDHAKIKRPATPTSPTEITNVFKNVSKSAGDDMSQWKTYSNKQLGISFSYPPDFAEPELINSGMGGGYIIAVGKPNQQPMCPIAIEQVPTGTSIDDVVDQQKQMMQLMGPMRLSDSKIEKIGGLDVRVMTLTAQNPQTGQTSKSELTMMQKQNRILTVRLDLQADSSEQKIVKNIIKSITAVDVTTVGTLAFHGVKHNVDIELPSVDLKIKPDTDNDAVVFDAVVEDLQSGALSFGIKLTSKPKREYTATFELLVNRRKEKLAGKSDLKENSDESLVICGMETHAFEFVDTLAGKKRNFMEILFADDKHTFIATLFAEPERYESFSGMALNSLRKMRMNNDEGIKRSKDRIAYTNDKHNFSIEVEKDVSLAENLMTDPIVTATYLENAEKEQMMRMFQTMVTVEENAFGNDIDLIRSQIKKTIEDQRNPFGMPASTIKSDDITKINGRDAVAIDFASMDQFGGDISNTVHLLPLDDKLYTIKTQTLAGADDDELKAKIKSIHNSFKFLDN